MGFEAQQNHLVNYPIGLGYCLLVYDENHFRYEGKLINMQFTN